MRAPGFWWRTPPAAPARLLQPFGALYGALTLARMRRPGAKAGIPVVCVGNFVAGGAGKTPTVLALAAMLAGSGEKPFVLSRGYGGREAGPLRVEPGRHGPADIGDEPLLMAHRVPVVVARDRPAGAALAQSQGASLVLMDDGLQNPSLSKDLRLAVVDGATGIGNKLCFPAGPLRAPIAGQLQETNAVVVIGAGEPGDAVAGLALAAGRPVLRAALVIPPEVGARLDGVSVLAASGIGRPEKFAASLRQAGARLAGERHFGDHHAYTARDVAALIAEAKALGCTVAVTEKDMVKLGPLWPDEEGARLLFVPVSLRFADEAPVAAMLRQALTGSGTAAAAHP
ncbi:tetraacyldisaccharide 4'-kinase [Bosea sp. (in: a-proteobacteria)]|uniref:tetraacyldisaccharide 4'-kinase n=1 Tax=Bosea sp. (in: a-proteobacteria) TaxID=1871050 RepID=UPI003FA5A89F